MSDVSFESGQLGDGLAQLSVSFSYRPTFLPLESEEFYKGPEHIITFANT